MTQASYMAAGAPVARSDSNRELLAAVQEIAALMRRHVFGSPEHLETVKDLTLKLQDLQREGAVTSYELGEFTPDAIHLHVSMRLEDFTLEKRQRVRRELRKVGEEYGLYVDSHIQPDTDCGASE